MASSRLGVALLFRVLLLALWVWTVRSLRDAPWTSVTSVVAAVLGILTVLTFSFAGHAAAESTAWLYAPLDAVHMLSVSAWAGGLLVIAVVTGSLGELSAPTVGRFSRTATWAMPVAVITGAAQGLHLMGGTGRLTGNDYGRFFLGKLALVVVITVFAARARRLVRVGGATGAVVRLEAALVLVVLVLTAGLVASSPRDLSSQVESFSVTLAEQGIIADIAVTPPRTGTAEVHAVFSPPGGAITPVEDVTVRMELPSRGVPMIPVRMTEIGANHWTGVVQVPFAGDWSMEVLVSPGENRQVRFVSQMPIRG